MDVIQNGPQNHEVDKICLVHRPKKKRLNVANPEITRLIQRSGKSQSTRKSTIDRTELIFRLKRTINALEKTPAEDRRPIYSNLIKFAELHPKKIRLGIYAPTFQRPKWPLVLILQMSWVRVVLGLVGAVGLEPTILRL